MNDNVMEVFDENGNKILMEILFTTKLDEYNKNYVFYFNQAEENGQVYVSSYEEDGRLTPVSDEKEWDKLNEVFCDYLDSQKCGNCHGEDCSNCESCDDCQNCESK